MGDNMIKYFKVKNYKNFQDEITVDFSNPKDYRFNQSVIKNGLINKAVIVGDNSSGKSNLGLALFDITIHLVERQQIHQQHINYLNANSDETLAYFEYCFLFGENEVLYKYRKKSSRELTYEELYVNNKKVFSYNFELGEGDLSGLNIVGLSTLNLTFKDRKISIVRFIATGADLPKDSVLNELMSFVSNMLWFRSLQQNDYIGFKYGTDFIVQSIISNNWVKDFESFLNKVGINDKLEVIQEPNGEWQLYIKYDKRSLNFLTTASNGTLSLMLYFFWSKSFDRLSFLFIDEFDAFYHFRLAEAIIKDVIENKEVQAVFTTHNTYLLDNNILRPDCYFNLLNGKLISFNDATEKELREGHNLGKLYRQNEFQS